MRKLLGILLLTCKKATLLIELDQEGLLSNRQKFQLKIHLKICEICNIYKTQSKNMNELLKRKFSKKLPSISNPELKEKIHSQINKSY